MNDPNLGVYRSCAVCSTRYWCDDGTPVCSLICEQESDAPHCEDCGDKMDSETSSGYCDDCEEQREDSE